MNDQRDGSVHPADDGGEDGPSPFSREGAAAAGSADRPPDAAGQRADDVPPESRPATPPPYPPAPPYQVPWAEPPPPTYGSAAPDPYGQAGGYVGYGPPAQPDVPATYVQPRAYGSGYGAVHGYGPGYGPPDHPKATPALVTGIVGLVLSVFGGVGGLVGIAGVVLGSRAKREIDGDPARWTGRSKAHAGLVTGIVGLALLGLWVLIFVIAGIV